MNKCSFLIIDPISPEFHKNINRFLLMPIYSPQDYVFDFDNMRLAVALNFEGHPVLWEKLGGKNIDVSGGRIGRIGNLQIGSSEWSGHLGGSWNEERRHSFHQFMVQCGLRHEHYKWITGQSANYIGTSKKKVVRDIALIGLGPHARRIYYPLIAKHQSDLDLTIRLIVELEEKRKDVEDYIQKFDLKPDLLVYIPKGWGKPDQLPLNVEKLLTDEIKGGRIQGMIVAADPRSHMVYYELAIKNNCHILSDKPLTAPDGLCSDPESNRKMLEDFNKITKMMKGYSAQFIVQTQRRAHSGYLLVQSLIRELISKHGVPVSSLNIQHSDGMWVMPHEWDRDSHPYKYGFGKLMHSGYHFIDLLCWFLKENGASTQILDTANVFAQTTFPVDSQAVLQKDRQSFFPQQKEMTDIDLSGFGEVDAYVSAQFLSNNRRVTTAQLQLQQNSFSDRDFSHTPSDIYKGIGRVRHERVDMKISSLVNIQVHSYQAFSKREDCNVPYGPGHIDHFDVTVYRNHHLIGGPRFESIEIGREVLSEAVSGSVILGHNESARERLMLDFLFGSKSQSDVSGHANTNFLMAKIYECISNEFVGNIPYVSTPWPM